MSTITTRSGKGAPLTNNEVDSNFTNLNTDKAELSGATFTGDVKLGDNDKATFGASDDLQIFHNGTESFIREVGEGGLKIDSNGPEITLRVNATENALMAESNGAVTAYYNNVAKLATTATGIDVTGNVDLPDNGKLLLGASDDLQIYHDGNNSRIVDAGTGYLKIQATDRVAIRSADDSTKLADFYTDGAVKLYYANAEKLTTTSTGIDVTGKATMDGLTVDGVGSFNNADNENLFIADTTNTSRSSLQISGATTFFNGNIDTASHGLFVWRSSNAYTERMRIDSSGSLLVGKTTNSFGTAGIALRGTVADFTRDGGTPINVNRLTSSGSLIDFHQASAVVGSIGSSNTDLYIGSTNHGIKFHDISNAIMPWIPSSNTADSSGTLDLGTSLYKFKDLHLSGDIQMGGNLDVVGQLGAYNNSLSSWGSMLFRAADYIFKNAGGTEKMRIDSAGNLLVGQTIQSPNTVGVSLNSNGNISAKRNGGIVGLFNRGTSDGTIVDFRKDGEPVGSIGTGNSGNLYIGSGDTGINFNADINSVYPINPSNGAASNGAIDLGYGGIAFKDLYLSGTATATAVNTGAGAAGRNAFSSGDIRVAAPNDTNISLMTVSNTLATIKTDFYGGGSLVPLVLQTGTNTNQLYLDTAGKVGIGTSSPSAKLTLNDAGQQVGIDFKEAGTTRAHIEYDGAIPALELGTNGAANVVLKTSNAERMRINSAGNVGIGVVPSSEFHVKGDANTIARIEPNNNSGKATLLVSSTGSGDGGIQYDANNNETHLFSYSNMTFNVGTGNLSGGYPANERMRIDSAGNVGIGTSSPSAALHVSASAEVVTRLSRSAGSNSLVLFQDPTTTTAPYIGSYGNEMAFGRYGGGESMRIDSAGNVGIGTDSPSQALHVNRANNTATGIGLQNSERYYAVRSNNYSLVFSDETVGSERMRIDSAGRVGIGTSSPAELLHLESSTVSPSLLVKAAAQTGNTTTTAELILANGSLSSNDSAPKVIAYRTADYSTAALRSSGLKFQTTNANAPVTAMTLDNSGNVGIGTSSPNSYAGQTTLNINSAGVARLDLDIGNTMQGYLLAESGYTGLFTPSGSNSLRFGTNSAERMRITSAGRVGIGEQTPLGLLHLRKDGDTADLILQVGGGSGRRYAIQSRTDGSLATYDSNAGSERMRIDATGNVLVNTTSTIPFLLSSGSGAGITPTGTFMAGAAAESGLFNRVGSDGNILGFYRSGTSVGSIGVQGSRPYFGNSINFSIKCDDANSGSLVPANQSGVPNDNVADIGLASNRWNDLYLGGGVVFGATGGSVASKTLDDYEEGTWTPALSPGASATNMTGIYTKVGRLVTAYLILENSTISGTPNYIVSGLPFTSAANRTALSVTYLKTFNTACESLGGFVEGNTDTMQFLGVVQGGNWVVANLTAGTGRYVYATAVYQTA